MEESDVLAWLALATLLLLCGNMCLLFLVSTFASPAPSPGPVWVCDRAGCYRNCWAAFRRGQATGNWHIADFTFIVNFTDHKRWKGNAGILDLTVLYAVFLPSVLPQGLFFDDSYGFYPGQVLIGPSKVFSSVQWLSGVKPVLSTKSKFRVVVEEVRTETLTHGHLLPCMVPGWLFGAESVCHGNLPRANVLWLWCSEVTNFSLGTGSILARVPAGTL